MKCLGRLCGLWSYHRIESETLRMREFEAAILAQTIVPNTDTAAREAANMGFHVAKSFDMINFRRQAAISRTNAAMRLLKIEQLTEEDVRSTVTALQSSRNAKKKYGVRHDMIYTEFNYAIALRRLADSLDSQNKFGKFKHSWKTMQRAIKMTNTTAHPKSLPPVIVSMNVADIIVNWAIQSEQDDNSSLKRYGPSEIDLSDARAILKTQLALTEDTTERCEIEFCLWKLNGLLSEGYIFTSVPAQYLDLLWSQHRKIEFTHLALKFVGGGEPDDNRYIEMLLRLVEGVKHFRDNRDSEDVSEFIVESSLVIRHAGVVLAFAGELDSAVEAFEISKGLIYGDLIVDARIAFNEIPNRSFVYVGHCPDGVSCVIARSNGESVEYDGFYINIDEMGEFNSLFIDVDRSLEIVKSVSQHNITEILDALKPIADFIEGSPLSTGVLTFIPMGYFQAFPVHALRSSAGQWISDLFDVVIAPSADATARGSLDRGNLNTNSLIVADSVSGWSDLPYSAIEPPVLRDQAPFEFEMVEPTESAFLEALIRSAVVHYSGHSFSHPDPWQGGLVLDSDVLTNRRLFDSDILVDFAFLNSCESGHSYNLLYSEEFITTQSILFYKGAWAVIGTVWPVSDRVAFAFSAIFYDCLSGRREDWYKVYAEAVRRLRNMTVSDFNCLLESVQAPSGLQIESRSGDVVLFSDYRHWASFSIMSRTLV